jgi:hypothetical protein
MKRIIYALLVTLSLLMQAPTAQNQTVSGATEKVLIRTRKPYNNVVAKIESLGGTHAAASRTARPPMSRRHPQLPRTRSRPHCPPRLIHF